MVPQWHVSCDVRQQLGGTLTDSEMVLFFREGMVGLVPKRGCLLTLAYYAFPTWYEFGERRWNDTDRGKTEKLEEKPVPVPLCPPQIPHGLTRALTRASAVRGRRLTTWAMATAPEWYVTPCQVIFLDSVPCLNQRSSNCCTRTTSDTPASFKWYTAW
jgi:hypothetical protein